MSKPFKWSLFIFLCCASAALAEETKVFYKTFHLNPYTVGVTCKDNSAPHIENYNSTGAVFVTCLDKE